MRSIPTPLGQHNVAINGPGGCSLSVAEPPTSGARKTVTLVFTDGTGSTAIGEQLDPESIQRVMTRYFFEMRAVIERHGGTVEIRRDPV
jgi:class 3 adenylate cyclase